MKTQSRSFLNNGSMYLQFLVFTYTSYGGMENKVKKPKGANEVSLPQGGKALTESNRT